jgi:acyl carrier protein
LQKLSFGFGDVNGCIFKNILFKFKKMNKEETLEQLKEIIKPYTNNQEAFDNFTADTDFIADLNINSANLVDIILDVEDASHTDNNQWKNA